MDFYDTLFFEGQSPSASLQSFRTPLTMCLENSLETITSQMLGTISSIRECTFYQCTNLKRITIPSSVTNIGDYVFGYCSSLVSVTVLATNPPELGEDVFANTSEDLKIYVPSGSLQLYKDEWSEYENIIYEIED